MVRFIFLIKEQIILTMTINKINDKNKVQERVIMITNTSIINMEKTSK